uniref:SCP domain-containing protein n=1 Tax=Mesocestoides corti TaxID=53468 RepID=A0A5K3F7G0_MESCO
MGHYPARCGVRGVSNWIFYQHWISTTVRWSKPEAEDSFTADGDAVWRRIRAQTYWTTWPQPIPCLSAIQWACEEVMKATRGRHEERYIMSGVAIVVYSHGRHLTWGSAM